MRIGLPDSIEILPQPVNAPEFVPVIGVIRHGFEYRAAQRSGRIKTQKTFPANLATGLLTFLGKYFS